jgi:glycosyltransferase involved in cell wall biosynthesis
LYATVNRLTDVVVANAEIIAEDVIKGQGMPAGKVRVIRNGVQMPQGFTQAERRAQRTALGATDETFVIGCVGNFRAMKRHDLLIDAFARLLPRHPRLRLVLVGDGELRPAIESHIKAAGLEHFVFLTGSVSHLQPLYNAFDLFVQASNSEGLPNVLLEASAAALPIVATAAGGSAEVTRDGDTGLLVPVDNMDALTAAMHIAIDDSELRRALGSAARAHIEKRYGMERFLREYAELYRGQLPKNLGV